MSKMPDEVWVSQGEYQLLLYRWPVDPLKGKNRYPRVKFVRVDNNALTKAVAALKDIASQRTIEENEHMAASLGGYSCCLL